MFKLAVSLFLAVMVLSTVPVLAHSGRTDSNGGHNCNVGSCKGTYHYHNGGGSSSTPKPTYTPPAPRVPVVTKKTQTDTYKIDFTEQVIYTSMEYDDYSVVDREGAQGQEQKVTEITFTDGKETSRAPANSAIVTPATNKVIKKGNRIRPEAKITSVTKTNKKDKYDISGEYKPNSEVVLAINKKKVKRTKTNNEGKFTFKSIKIKQPNVELEIHKRVKRKENQVSEKTYTELQNLKIQTEYDRIHAKQ